MTVWEGTDCEGTVCDETICEDTDCVLGCLLVQFAGLFAGLCAMWKRICVAKVSKFWFHVKHVNMNMYLIETYRSTKDVNMAK